MCGLAGIFQYRASAATPPLSATVGKAMTSAISHRGPDDGGLLVTNRLLLGHRRLAIIDLSSDGQQPMCDPDEQVWLAFNGEIYNFRELRTELEAAGYRFRSRTDTEVILHGYRHWGSDVARRLNGMFAWVLWDRRRDAVWLVRDAIGIKPLFYRDDGSKLWFGSEIKAILADESVPRVADWQGLDGFLTLGYLAAPRTGFQGIRQLLPGESLWVDAEGVQPSIWRRLPYPDRQPRGTLADCTERLESALDAAVRRQMVSDVPLGALLSGGLDSSAIVRSMSRSGSQPPATFTVGFDEASFDETPYAALVARHYGTQHHEQHMAADALAQLRTCISHAEEPLADNSMIPCLLLSQMVRERVTVALSGDGADELLAGYATYQASRLAPWYRRLPRWFRQGMIGPAVRRLPVGNHKYSLSSLAGRFVAAADRPAPWDHCSWRRYVSEELRTRLYTERFLNASGDDPLSPYVESLNDAPEWLSPLEQQLHLDLRFHLPNDLLVKVDRMSMAHSLEVRVPFLDWEVITTCLDMPPECKLRGKRGKLPLRKMLEADLPPEIVNRKKAGFLAPLERWLSVEWQPLLKSQLSPRFADETGLFDPAVLRQMIESQARGTADFAYPLFALLVLSIWWETWITRTQQPQLIERLTAPLRIIRLSTEQE